MRKVLLPLLASIAVASPAMANEARVEARGGVFWSDGYTQDSYGVAAGYDFDLGETLFAGAEISADKIADTGTKVAFGFTGRAGVKTGEAGKLFVASGYTTDAGKTWQRLDVPGSAYYPHAVQTKDGQIFIFAHVGSDDPYGKADQSIVMDTFQLKKQ